MKKFALLALVAAALSATVGGASAQIYYYSGPGYGRHVEPRYEPGYQYYRPGYGERRYYRRQARVCPRNYTVQDGVCKPYRGY